MSSNLNLDPYAFPFVRPIYGGPACDVAGSVGVGIGGESARLAREVVACGTVLFADVSARRTSPTGIAWVNKLHRHSDKPALVGDLFLKIVKSPRVQDSTLLSGSPYPTANALEIFQGNAASGAFCNIANLFGNHMILVSDKSGFPATKPPQDTPTGSSALGLKALSLPPSAIANTRHIASISVGLTVRRLSQIHQTQINTKPGFTLGNFGLRKGDRHKQIKLSTLENQVSLTALILDHFPLAWSTNKRNVLASINRPDAHRRCGHVPRQNAFIVGKRSQRSKCATHVHVDLVGVNHLCVGTDNDLRRENRECFSTWPINKVVKRDLRKDFSGPCFLGNPVASGIGCLKSDFKCQSLFVGRQQFHLHSQLHERKLHHCIDKASGFMLDTQPQKPLSNPRTFPVSSIK